MRTVLVVDDAAMVRRQVGRILGALGYTIVEAVDGVDALQKPIEAPDTGLILLDVHMPRMNGLEFLERLATRATAPPVIMLTADGQPELIRRAKALGARAWIVKPVPESLGATVQRMLPIRG